MLLWINGPFGGGKTTTMGELLALLPDAVTFDTEQIGYAIAPTLKGVTRVRDFQDWAPWREIAVASLVSLERFARRVVVVPQTIVVEQYWDEIVSGLADARVIVKAFTLDCDPAEHERRIAADVVEAPAAGWRRERADDFYAARSWLGVKTDIIDTTALPPVEVATRIAAELDRS